MLSVSNCIVLSYFIIINIHVINVYNVILELISGQSNLTVRASKIISGQEPTKTNELLQAIGKCLDKKVMCFIRYYFK